jgi:hypothetical protein
LAAYAIALLWLVFRHPWLFDAEGRPYCISDGNVCHIDFPWMWLAGSVGPAGFEFVYPPTYFLLIYPLSWMPYGTAFIVWMLGGLLLYLAALYLIIRRPVGLLAALAPFPVLFNVELGHNGFLIAGLLGLALVVIEHRPWLAGVFLGLLSFKPQIGILFPFALWAARQWRAAASAAATVAIFAGAATLLCGYQAWQSFADLLIHRGPDLAGAAQRWRPLWLESLHSFLQSAGFPTPIAWAVHLTLAGIIAVAVCCWMWARPAPHALKAAALCGAALFVTPFVHGPDFCILAIGGAFLVQDGMARGWLPGERLLLLAFWLGLVLYPVGMTGTGWIACLFLLALVARRTRRVEAGAPPAQQTSLVALALSVRS